MQKGIGEEYSTFVVEVTISQKNGSYEFVTTHQLQSEDDLAVVQSLPTFGNEQIAHGLLMEALRREIFFQILQKEKGEELEEKENVYVNLKKEVVEMITTTVEQNVELEIQRVLEMMEKG